MRIYGEAAIPGAPGTWHRDVWFALNRSARVGAGTGRHRWRHDPPFRYRGSLDLLVTAGIPNRPYGRSTAGKAYLTHLPHTVLFAWHRGHLVGRMVAWWCGARTAYFTMQDEPTSPLCVPCGYRMAQHGGTL